VQHALPFDHVDDFVVGVAVQRGSSGGISPTNWVTSRQPMVLVDEQRNSRFGVARQRGRSA
jgi:hypothetical protein